MDLSIIIPAYNCIDTIERTIESILIQKLSINFETIIVNDCSDYDYSKVIDKYKDKLNIKEIKTPKNGGPGVARQYGIDNSSSTYITFIDADDYFYDDTSIIKMYNEIKDNDLDLVISNFVYERDNIVSIKKENFAFLHGKMYKREFLEKHDIHFNNSKQNEDNGFNRLILLLDPKYKFLDEIVYVYKENENSITRKNNRAYKFEGLEGLTYNINWALDEAIKRGNTSLNIGLTALDTLILMYYYYLDLQYDYDVDKILEWSKDLYLKYKSNSYILNKLIDDLKNKKYEFIKDEVNIKEFNISFDDFLSLINNKIK